MEEVDTTEAMPQDEPMKDAGSSPVAADQGAEGKDEKPAEDAAPSKQTREKNLPEEVTGDGDKEAAGDGDKELAGDGDKEMAGDDDKEMAGDGDGGEEKEEQAKGAVEEVEEQAKEAVEEKVEEQGKGAVEKTKKPAKEEPKRSIEKEVGITEYAGNHEGFFGIIKQR